MRAYGAFAILLLGCADPATSEVSVAIGNEVRHAASDAEVLPDTVAEIVDTEVVDVAEHEIEVGDAHEIEDVHEIEDEDVHEVEDEPEVEVIDEGPTRYAGGRLHSELTPAVARAIGAIAARAALNDDMFMKVGDSITVAQPFLHCLADAAVDLQGRADLAATRALFGAAFDRESLAALSGRTAAWAITAPDDGSSPLTLEREAMAPRFAVVMFGTNDIGYWPDDFPRMFRWYGESMLALLDELVGAGVVPILSSIPPRADSPDVLDPRVAGLNALVLGLAEAYQVPFVDFHLALASTSDGGLSADGVHPRAACEPGGVRCGCRFDASGLGAGYNVRNWVTLEALDRTRRALAGEAPPDAPLRPALAGRGSAADPFIIDALPFVDHRDARTGTGVIDRYRGCGAAQDESGPEVYYRLELAEQATIAAVVIDRAGVDVDVHVLASNDPDDCRARNDTYLEATLDAGSWVIVVDSFVGADGVPRAGDYVLALTRMGE